MDLTYGDFVLMKFHEFHVYKRMLNYWKLHIFSEAGVKNTLFDDFERKKRKSKNNSPARLSKVFYLLKILGNKMISKDLP